MSTADSNFKDLTAKFHAHKSHNPNVCVELGIDKKLAQLPDPSTAAAQAQLASGRALLAEFEQLPAESLEFEEQLDVRLAQLMLRAEEHDESYLFNGQSTRAQKPRAGDDIGDGIFMLSVADPRPAPERLSDITARIEAIPEYLGSALQQLTTPVARWASMDIEKIEELPTLLSSIHGWAEQEQFADSPRLKRACNAANEGLQAYGQHLSKLPTTEHFHVGTDVAEKIVKYRGIDQSLDELHALSRSFLAQTAEELEELRRTLASKYHLAQDVKLSELQSFLNRKFRVDLQGKGLSQVLTRYREEHSNLLKFIGERSLFPIPDGQELKILATPGFMQPSIPAGAMTPPAPFRSGTKTSLIFLTLSDELLDEHTELTIPIMMVHEGIPGHHLQLSTASLHPSVIRRHTSANDHAEGWTTMLEDFMLEAGYLPSLVDEARFCAKRDICRIGARVAIDLFFMTGERDYLSVGVDTSCQPLAADGLNTSSAFRDAGRLLQTVTGFTAGRTQAELNWYSQERGYPLSYLTGNRLVADLRAELSQAHSGKSAAEVDQIFFGHYLNSGNMPLSFLRSSFEHRGLLPARP